jgi:hypothetical protein
MNWKLPFLTCLISAMGLFNAPAQTSCFGDELTASEQSLEDQPQALIYLAQQPKPKPTAEPAGEPAPKAVPKPTPKKPPVEIPDIPLPSAPPSTVPMPDVSMLAAQSPVLRLASVPNMLGDFFNQGGQFQTLGGAFDARADLPLAGGGRRIKIAENNKALPMNRWFVMYHHFHNALTATPKIGIPDAARDDSVNRYTIGLERTFLGDCWSVDVRMPFYESYRYQAGGAFGVSGGDIGNLSVTLKRLLFVGETGAAVAGLAIETPTGSDVRVHDVSITGEPFDYTVQNQAVHLSPYLGLLRAPNDRSFYHAFLQLDVPMNGNGIDFVSAAGPTGSLGKLTEQSLLHVDVSAGYWLYRNPCACCLTGIASLVEFHYTTTLQDADIVSNPIASNTVQFGNFLNRVDVTNVTVGLHGELGGRTTLRVGGVFPLQDDPERPFDAEIHVMLNRYY